MTQEILRALRSPFGWAGALLLAIVLCAPALIVARFDDEWATSQSLIDAQLSAYEQAKKDRAAAQVCGNAEPIWIDEVTVSCAQRKGPKYSGAVALAGGAL